MANEPNPLPRKTRLFVLGALLLLGITGVFFALRQRGAPARPFTPVATPSEQDIVEPATLTEEEVVPMSIRLSEGQAQPTPVAPLPPASGEPLSAEEIDSIVARLPGLRLEPGDETGFRLAGEPIPPPRTGETIQEPFPPEQQAVPTPEVAAGPLEVLRFSPEGEIPVAPFLQVTFNQPMVPLASLEELAAQDVPVRIEPALEGTWRWLGANTLTFQYDSTQIDRLPKATIYRVTVPAGTRSAAGGTLAESVEWTFSTPPVQVAASYPTGEPQGPEPLLFISFDQRIDPQAVLDTIRLTAGRSSYALRLATEEEIQADKTLSQMVEGALPDRWLVFRPQEPLPLDTQYAVEVGPGTPSAEGPRVSEQAHSFTFRTYAPLKVVEHGCSWAMNRNECQPLTPFYVRFNNPLDLPGDVLTLISISPELPGISANLYGDYLEIQGATEAQTTYTLSLSPEIRDIFGQTLGRQVNLTFRVGPVEPLLSGSGRNFLTVDPSLQEPAFSVYTINYNRLDVEIYAVQPADWPAFQRYLREYGRTDVNVQIPGRLVHQETLRLEAPSDKLTETSIPLAPHMDGDFGHFIVVVRPPADLLKRPEPWRYIQTWVQVTQIGVDAFTDHSEMVVWTSSLQDGSPLAGVNISPAGSGTAATSGEDGTARFPLPSGATYLVAELGADRAILPRAAGYGWEEPWQVLPVYDELRWYVFDDRQMYRPGEEVHLKGWMRLIGGRQDGDVGLAGEKVNAVQYRVSDSQGNEIAGGRAEVSSLGGFDFAFTLPEKVNLGYTEVILTAEGSLGSASNIQTYHSLQIQEFRRPEFEVTARNETPAPYFAGERAVVAVAAKYYAGGPLQGAPVEWSVSFFPTSYSPPKWPDFSFGIWQPWWYYEMPAEPAFDGPYGGTPEQVLQFSGETDAAGEHYLNLDFETLNTAQPYSVDASAGVMDVNRQAWASSTHLLVHPAELYVGLRSPQIFVDKGTPIRVDLIVTDLDGSPVADRPVEVRAARLEWKVRQGTWSEEEVEVQTCTVGSALEPVSCTFETPLGGTYRITAEVTDAQGRLNRSQLTRWVSGGERPPSRKVERETVTLIPDKESYQPGDTAQVLVQSPFSPAEGLLTVSRSGILYTLRFRIEDGTATLSIPVEEAHIPNLSLQVDLAGSAPRTDEVGEPVPGAPRRPAFATGSIDLSIPPLQRTLTLEVNPTQVELEPGGDTTVDVQVLDASGRPAAGAELAVVVVDEAVLALSGYHLADPLAVFYADRPSYLYSVYGRESIILADPQRLASDAVKSMAVNQEAAAADMAEAPAAAEPPMMATGAPEAEEAGRGNGQAASPIRVRTDFNPLAAFIPAAVTAEDGRATVPVHLPDNLTRYRVMVVAVEEGQFFGLGEANITARLPLMVRPSAPRFLNFGDRFELPVVLQNQTDEPLAVNVVVQAGNLELVGEGSLQGGGQAGLRVEVPARDRVEVRFPAAARMAGTARLQIGAVAAAPSGGEYADAAVLELPVYTPATTEAFATYGVLDAGSVSQPLSAPQGVFPQFGGLEITTSSTALQALTDAVLYLVRYPYDCSEQIASRILAIAALRDVLTAFEAEGLPAPAELEASVQRDIATLQGMQNEDGGFPTWRRGMESVPINSIHVAHALQRAEAKGFSVPSELRARVLEHLRQIENYYPSWYSRTTRQVLSAYALYVRDLMGDPDPAKAQNLLRQDALEELPLEVVGWLWPVLQDDPSAAADVEDIRRLVNNRVVETAGAANFTTAYDEQDYLLLRSDRRTDAILLDALIGDSPQSDLIPKLVNGLLAQRTRGHWESTQENAFVLLALDRYFNTYEAQTPDFVARVWLGEGYAGDHEFRGRTTERAAFNAPMSYLVEQLGEQSSLTLSKEGQGRLYYRLAIKYAPTSLEIDPLDMGFTVQRVYEAVDDPGDVVRDEQGRWIIKAGARVRVRLTMEADNRRYHVALSDPLPAGLEALNPALAVTESLPLDPQRPDPYSWWWGPWFQHQNLRDERAEAFTTLLWEGVYQYTYVARATTPGEFVVPPAKAEEMYSPEVFGRSASDLVIVR